MLANDSIGNDKSGVRAELVKEGRTFLGLRLSALVEMALFFALALAIDYSLGQGNRYIHLSPHPYWIILLLVIIQYGVREALFCAFAASAILLAWNMPGQGIEQSIYDYLLSLTYRPFMWLSAALILGQLSSRHMRQKKKLRQDLKENREHATLISRAYENVKQIKEGLEKRVAQDVHSAAHAYHALRSLDASSQGSVLLGAEEVIKQIMNPEKCSIYSFGTTGFEVVTSLGWEEKDRYQSRFDMASELTHYITKQRDVVCVINQADRDILKEEGLMVMPLINPDSGQIFGMIKIEAMKFSELTLTNIEMFKALCEWIGKVYEDATQYQKAKEYSMIDFEDGLLSRGFCNFQQRFMQGIKKKYNIASTIVDIEMDNIKDFLKEERMLTLSQLTVLMKEIMPDMAQIFDGKQPSKARTILLPGHDKKQTLTHLKKLRLAMDKDEIIGKATWSFSLTEL